MSDFWKKANSTEFSIEQRVCYPKIEIETLQKMASYAIATAIEDNFADVHERYVSYHDVRHNLQNIIDKSAQ